RGSVRAERRARRDPRAPRERRAGRRMETTAGARARADRGEARRARAAAARALGPMGRARRGGRPSAAPRGERAPRARARTQLHQQPARRHSAGARVVSRVVGIDLGTTNSLVAYVSDGVPVVIRDRNGDGLVPSVVSAAGDGTIYVGREAGRRLLTDAARTVYSVKRFMGKGFDDVRGEARHFPFRVSGDSGSAIVRIGLGDREFTPPEISAFILRELKHRAEAFFAAQGDVDPQVDRAVITVPAYFNDAQRTATRDAGRIAGLDVLRIINEPTAASLAYGLDKRHTGLIAVYDFGGGTFDISILRVEDGVFQVLSTNGDTHLGGDDIDALLIERVLAEMGAKDLAPEAVQAVRKAAIEAKWELSDKESASLVIDGV